MTISEIWLHDVRMFLWRLLRAMLRQIQRGQPPSQPTPPTHPAIGFFFQNYITLFIAA
jgi:hypothetical protein